MENKRIFQPSTEPLWKSIIVKSKLPKELACLHEMSRNLWWCWNYDALDIFESIDQDLWEQVGKNPILLLEKVSLSRLKVLAEDANFVENLNAVYGKFRAYLERPFEYKPRIAYFSMEYGLTNILKIYSGGLGILAGDYLKEASDSCVNMVGVGLLYRYGYFSQTLSINGEQQANYEAQEFQNLPIDEVRTKDGQLLYIPINFPGRQIQLKVWKAQVGRIPLYLLDSDHVLNSQEDRQITHTLYGGDWENRLKQEIVLGMGGVRLLDTLGIESDVYHCNEGHAALLNVQRLVNLSDKDLKFSEALEVVRVSSLFTTHTPVPAGHDSFDEGLMHRYFSHVPELLNISWNEFMDLGRESSGKFSMSVLAARTSQEMNGVSWLHGEVTKDMFKYLWPGFTADELHINYVTNGVHYGTWTASEMQRFYEEYLGSNLLKDVSNKAVWEKIYNVDDVVIWDVRKRLKKKLFDYVKNRMVSTLNANVNPSRAIEVLDGLRPNALTIGFARRFATYKRAHLLFTDLERLSKIVNNPEHPVQFIFAGKAHPADGGGQNLIKNIVEISHRPEFLGKIIFLENYDMELSRRLISGVDVWLNTPTRPLEASGTSGQKAELNGVLNFSVLDGWWYEGYKEDAGWAITDKQTYRETKYQDELDAAIIYQTLENEIIPLYYNQVKDVPKGWISFIKKSLAQIAPDFTTKRMITDYLNKFYIPQEKRGSVLMANNFKAACDLAAWKQNVRDMWDGIEVVDVEMPDISKEVLGIGDLYKIRITIDKKNTDVDLGMELVFATGSNSDNTLKVVHTEPFEIEKVEGSIVTYKVALALTYPGLFKFGIRIFPSNTLLPHKQDFPLLKWL
ncbi:MAG: alpha-glucan family phosphorylase [Bacteroidales bacterium]|nr:alpha-glucan family phosphorylase [Bacteroidales bacterium]MCR5696196.1 alpha-glucan family phosphorylase [Marinilabiliaceae bacterium]